MYFYRIGILRLIKYLGLDELFKEDERIVMLRNRRKRKDVKKQLEINDELDLNVSKVMSVLAFVTIASMPFSILENPCELFKELQLNQLHALVQSIYDNMYVVDIVMLSLVVLLVRVSSTSILYAIKNTKINISPWIERGKYTMPEKRVIIEEPTPEIDYNSIIRYQKSQNVILNGRYYEQQGGILRERKLEEYRVLPGTVNRDEEMTIQELIMFEKQYDLYRNRVLCEMRLKEKQMYKPYRH